jgi:Flp pilus assembly protein TadD
VTGVSRIEQIEKMLASSPDDAFLNFALAMEQVKAGRPEQAVARFQRVAELDPNYLSAYTQLSKTLIALGRKDEARAVLSRGVDAATRTGDKHAAAKMRDTLTLLA